MSLTRLSCGALRNHGAFQCGFQRGNAVVAVFSAEIHPVVLLGETLGIHAMLAGPGKPPRAKNDDVNRQIRRLSPKLLAELARRGAAGLLAMVSSTITPGLLRYSSTSAAVATPVVNGVLPAGEMPSRSCMISGAAFAVGLRSSLTLHWFPGPGPYVTNPTRRKAWRQDLQEPTAPRRSSA